MGLKQLLPSPGSIECPTVEQPFPRGDRTPPAGSPDHTSPGMHCSCPTQFTDFGSDRRISVRRTSGFFPPDWLT
ncbi:hypothetical protein RRG08_037566 [Elysia crispata]|uniref:Uncharacterized protein n=1 Tax=Elysia crispata TaxID=231223 RepID=A0AAE1CTS4_9GAST|nr:hypothetical protein RRG08_037566 [Elysia crispata]